ncbi:hypothetical protein EXN66_Car017262 [Channa argus]|uniref:Uncharacterized protein n=1 Tax=Channa argus TaxID=215402 RepID=A0A6G1QGK5_CHAAH|nr:hypothetical protein EXN66_Car017262 [Channa argus]
MCREYTCLLSSPKVSTSCVEGGRDKTALLYSLMADEQNNQIRYQKKKKKKKVK